METLATADGRAIDLDQTDAEFAKAMAAPRSDDPEAPAPPKREAPDPEAPYGRKSDGTPKAKPGRHPKPRMIEAPKDTKDTKGGAQQAKTSKTAADYAQGVAELLGGLQLALAVLPIPNDNIRVHARYQSAVIEQTGDGLATGIGICAEHNSTIRWGVEKLTQGGGAWVFPAVMAIGPFAVSTAMLWKIPVTPEMAANADLIEEEAKARFTAEFNAMKADFDTETKMAQEDEANFGPA